MKVITYSFLFTLLICVCDLNAQPQLPPQNPPEPVPITGIEYLILGGGIYGIYRFSKKRNKNNEA